MNKKENSTNMTLNLALAAVFAALVCIATIIFRIEVPATSGYFNIGETIIYVTALLFGPLVGSFAGGLGSAIADMIGFPIFAPGTLVIKGFEGAIVGILNKKMLTKTPRLNWRIYTTILGVIVGVLLAITGSIYYHGDVNLYLGIPPPTDPTLTIFVLPEIWYFLGGIVALVIVFIGFKIEPEVGRAILSTIVGGLEMVAGYFLYEQLILSNPAAIVEVLPNIGQMLIGLIVAIPIVKIVLRSLPQLKS
jgi:uncharacterized membrane protein